MPRTWTAGVCKGMLLLWTAFIAGAAGAGCLLAGLLVVPRRAEPLAAGGSILSLTSAIWGLVALVREYARVDIAFAAVLLGMASVVAGYGLGAALLHYLVGQPAQIRLEPPVGDDPRTGVVLLAEADPERYSPRRTAEEIAELEAAGGSATPASVSPFVFAAQKARYRASGDRSPSRETLRAIARRLGGMLDPARFATPVIAYTADANCLLEEVAALATSGHRAVVVCPLAVAEGRPHESAKRVLDAGRPAEVGLRVFYAPPLWRSDALTDLVSSRVLKACDGVESTTGVVLVTHGQPPEWERDFPSLQTDEVSFAHRVRSALAEGGLSESNVRLAWDGWHEPEIPEVVRHLAALGCARVFVVPACEPAESLATIFDLHNATQVARVSVPTRVMPAWNDAPEVAQALAESIERGVRDELAEHGA